MKPGMPGNFTPELAQRICDELAEGKSLVKICQAKDMPSRPTVLRWKRENPAFEAECARARIEGGDAMDARILDVAERAEIGLIDPHGAKVAISAYQWRASKLNSKAYGEKSHHEHSGEVTLKQLVLQSLKPREEG